MPDLFRNFTICFTGNGSSFVDNGLSEADPEVRAIIEMEKERQFKSLGLLAQRILLIGQLWRQLAHVSRTSIRKDYQVKGIDTET